MTSTPQELVQAFIASFNQWQRNSYLRHRLDNYDFTGKNIRESAEDKTTIQLRADFDLLTTNCCSTSSRLRHVRPSVVVLPPIFEGCDKHSFRTVNSPIPNQVFVDVVAALDQLYRFVIVQSTSECFIEDIICPPDADNPNWLPAEF